MAKENEIVYCNECKEDFKIKLKEEELREDLIRHYFACPSCGTQYDLFITNVKVRELKEKSKAKFEEYRTLRVKKNRFIESFNALNEHKRLNKQIKNEMEKIN